MAEENGTGGAAGDGGAAGGAGGGAGEGGAAAKPDEGLGDAGKKALQDERRARSAAEKTAKELGERLQALEDSQKTEAQKTADRATKAEASAAAANAKLLRFEIAAEKGLKPAQAARLAGSTREELLADADAYLAEVGGAAPSYDGGARKTAPGPTDMNALIRQAAGLQ